VGNKVALMMEAARTSESLVNFYQSTRRYNPEDSHLRTHSRENLKSYFVFAFIHGNYKHVALGGIVVSVLATGPKVRGFKPGRGRWILRVIKSAARLPSEGK
jgi:hypothetical protein